MFRQRTIVLTIAAAMLGCTPPENKAPVTPPDVFVATPIEKEITDFADYTGRTEAPESVDVRARVTGYIVQAEFKEGSEVKKGDLLFVIDPRPYQEELNVAEGQVAVAKARAVRATQDLKRADEQRKTPGVISAQEYDQIAAAKVEADAAVRATEATVGGKKLNLEFSRITAPIDGRVSRINYTVGNLVSADNNLLTSIVSQDPMYVYFDLDELTMLKIQKLIREGKFRSARSHDDVPVFIGLAVDSDYPHKGLISFVDNKVNPSTGTLKVRATLANPLVSNTRVFAPGLFVRVRLPLGVPRKAIMISDRAVLTDQGRKFVYVVTDKNEVDMRPVELGQLHDGLRVVDSGLSAADRVIVVGVQRVRKGMTVVPKPGEMVFEPARKSTQAK